MPTMPTRIDAPKITLVVMSKSGLFSAGRFISFTDIFATDPAGVVGIGGGAGPDTGFSAVITCDLNGNHKASVSDTLISCITPLNLYSTYSLN